MSSEGRRSKGVFEKSWEQQQKTCPKIDALFKKFLRKVNQLSFSQVYKWGPQIAQTVIRNNKHKHLSLDLECYLSWPFGGTRLPSLSTQSFICPRQNWHKRENPFYSHGPVVYTELRWHWEMHVNWKSSYLELINRYIPAEDNLMLVTQLSPSSMHRAGWLAWVSR